MRRKTTYISQYMVTQAKQYQSACIN